MGDNAPFRRAKPRGVKDDRVDFTDEGFSMEKDLRRGRQQPADQSPPGGQSKSYATMKEHLCFSKLITTCREPVTDHQSKSDNTQRPC